MTSLSTVRRIVPLFAPLFPLWMVSGAATSARASEQPKPPEASVKLWLDTSADSACEQANPSSASWMLRNNEGRNVHVVLARSEGEASSPADATPANATQMKDTLGPREVLELGCEVSDGRHQTLRLISARF